MSAPNANAIVKKHASSGEKRGAGIIILEIVAILIFVLFMLPFLLVILNSAKTSKDIIISPISWPSDWTLIWKNIVTTLRKLPPPITWAHLSTPPSSQCSP